MLDPEIPAGDSRTGKIVKMASGSATVMPWRPEAMLALSEMWGRFLGENGRGLCRSCARKTRP